LQFSFFPQARSFSAGTGPFFRVGKLVYIISVIGSQKRTTAAEHQPNHTIRIATRELSQKTGLVPSSLNRAINELCDPKPNFVTARRGGSSQPTAYQIDFLNTVRGASFREAPQRQDQRRADAQEKAFQREHCNDADTAAAGQLRDEVNARTDTVEEIGTRYPSFQAHTAPAAIHPPPSKRTLRKRARPDPERTTERTPAAAQLPDLDSQVEVLVARYTCGSVIDAA